MEKNRTGIPEDYQFNLSDFALFLSVMKNPRAYRSVVSTIMEEPDIQIKEVKVEQVVLNKSGKRAIRLDAWARTMDERQFNMEMQNDTKGDDLKKRSRYYQSLIDTPILKSGKETKYKMLPSTVIIFITQEDIFERNLAKYTFTERCEEVEDLKLEDGTTKIFLNMCSKNGTPELVSMLQYMKETHLDNPEIVVKDSRLLELNEIVQEVKESEEWEAVKMNILEIGKEIGKEIGEEIGKEIGKEIGIEIGKEIGMELGEKEYLKKQIQKKLDKGCSVEEIADILEEPVEYIRELMKGLESVG